MSVNYLTDVNTVNGKKSAGFSTLWQSDFINSHIN